MAGLLVDVFVSLIANLIYDILKATSNCCTFRDIVGPQNLEKIITKLNSTSIDTGLIDKYPGLSRFLNSPTVIDLLHSYCSYKISGFFKTEVEQTETSKKEIYSHRDLALILTRKYSEFATMPSGISKTDDLVDFFCSIINIIFDEITDSLKIENKSEIILINNHVDNGFMYLVNKLDSFRERFENCVTAKIEEETTEFEQTKNLYNDIIKSNFSRTFIYLSDDYSFEQFYIPPVLKKARSSNNPNIVVFDDYSSEEITCQKESWKSIFFANNITYIVGKAGYGKSLLLMKIANSFDQLHIVDAPEHLVIHCDLKNFFSADPTKSKSLLDFMLDSMISKSLLDSSILTREFLEYYLNLGRCIILLDALDEVPKSKRNLFHTQLLTYFKIYSPNNKICITTRDRGFVGKKNVDILFIQPLTQEDISEYLDKMIQLKKFKSSEKDSFLRQARSLMFTRFLDNFLILSLLVSIYKSERKLPGTKIDLYRKCFDYIFKTREQEKLEELHLYDWKRLSSILKESTFITLSQLAAPNNRNIKEASIYEALITQYSKKFASQVETENSINEFLKFCSERTELFVPSNLDDEYRFFHRSFFEYFYARFLNQLSNVNDISKSLDRFDLDSELFELLIAQLKEENEPKYQHLIEHYFELIKSELEGSKDASKPLSVLTLMMQIVDDYQYIHNYFEIVVCCFTNNTQETEAFSSLSIYVAQWMLKEIKNNPSSREVFLSTYKYKILAVLLMIFYQIEKALKGERSFPQELNLRRRVLTAYYRATTEESFLSPTYYTILAFNLKISKELLDSITTSDLEIVSKNEGKRGSKKAQKYVAGYNYYSSLSDGDRSQYVDQLNSMYIL